MSPFSKVDSEDAPPEAMEDAVSARVSGHIAEMLMELGARLAIEVQKTEALHQQRLRHAIELVRKDLSAVLREEFETRLHESLIAAQAQFMERLHQAKAEAKDELDRLRPQAQAVSAELVSREAELASMDREAEAMLDDPDIEIAKMIRHNTTRNELRNYIRGLRFQAGFPPEKE